MSTAELTRPAFSSADTSLLHEAGFVRTRRCRTGLMTYITHDSYIGRSLDLYGEFSPGEAHLFRQIIKPGMTVLDVGANIGAHTVLFGELVGSTGKVYAYEPQRVLFQILCANVAQNGLFNVFPRQEAAGSAVSEITVPPVRYDVEGNYGCLSLGQYDFGEQVPVRTIDGLSLKSCHFIKIDVEGMEADVIRGARDTLARLRPLVYMENDREDNSRALIELMFSQDYRLFWHMTPYYKPDNYLGCPDNVFKGIVSINMLAVPRESGMNIVGLREVQSADEVWTQFARQKSD